MLSIATLSITRRNGLSLNLSFFVGDFPTSTASCVGKSVGTEGGERRYGLCLKCVMNESRNISLKMARVVGQ